MGLTCCMLALALFGADEPKASQPQLPSGPFVITIEIGGPSLQTQGSPNVAKDAAASDSGIAATAAAIAEALSLFAAKCPSFCEAPATAQPAVAHRTEDSKITKSGATPGVVQNVQSPLHSGSFPANSSYNPPAAVQKAPSAPGPVNNGEPQELWPMTLSDAIRISLDNSEIVRVISLGSAAIPVGGFEVDGASLKGPTAYPPKDLRASSAPIVISRTNADAAIWRFKSEVMAHVRSAEQTYWNLAQAHVALWAADRAFIMGKELVKQLEGEGPGHNGSDYGLAEAKERLERFNLDLVTRTSDVITTERQLRNILGLPPADNRRIIPVTPPTEARLEPDWDASLAQMINFQPDIVQQQLLVRVAELQLLIARNQSLPQLSMNALYQLNGLGQQLDSAEAVMTGSTLKDLNAVIAIMQRAAGLNSQPGSYSNFVTWQPGFTFQAPLGTRAPLANTRQAQYTLLRARAYLQQVMHQTTHSLARFFLEIDANYKQYAVAQRLRIASGQRLEAQRRYFETGKITVDRFFDAIAQHATAVANEHQYLASYNTSLVALSEAKGTLLADRNIIVAEKAPKNSEALLAAAKKDEVVTTTQATVQTDVLSTGAVRPPLPFATFTVPGPDLYATINTGIAVPMKAASPVEPPSTRAKEKALSWTISIKIGDSSAIELKGTIGANAQSEPSKTVD